MLSDAILLFLLVAVAPSWQPARTESSIRQASATQPASVATPRDQIMADITAGHADRALRAIGDHTRQIDEFDRFDLTGRACRVLKRYPQARDAFNAAIELRPHAAPTHFELGRVLAASGDAMSALEAFEQASFHGLDSADLHAEWARLLMQRGRTLGELATLALPKPAVPGDFVQTTAGDHVVVRKRDGESRDYALAGRDSALFHACRAVRRASDRGDLQQLLADVWAAAGLHENAAEAYARAGDLLPAEQRGVCLQRWSECLLAQRNYDGYFAVLRKWMSLPNGLPARALADAYARVAAAMGEGGDVVRQIRYLTFAVEVEPHSADRRLALADALSWAGRMQDAAEHWREALHINPDHARAEEVRVLLAEIRSGSTDERDERR